MRAGRRCPSSLGHERVAPYGIGGIGRREYLELALRPRQAAQALDRSRQGELGSSEALHEVAAPSGAEQLEVLKLTVDGGEAAGDALGDGGLAGDDPVALEQQLGQGARPGTSRWSALEQRSAQRPAPDHRSSCRGAAPREAAAAPLRALGGTQARGPQRRERIVGHLSRPGQVPEGLVELLGRSLQLEQVEPEAGALGEPLANGVVDLALRHIELGVSRRRTGEPDVLAEVEGDLSVVAPKRPGTDPDELAAGAELVEPGGAVGAEPPGQDVPLPGLRRERHSLQRDERLAQPIRAGAGAAVGIDVLPARQEAGQLARVGGLHLLAQAGEAGSPQAAQYVRLAPLSGRCHPGGAHREPRRRSAPAPSGPSSGRRRSGPASCLVGNGTWVEA